jgi:hypothetical protein
MRLWGVVNVGRNSRRAKALERFRAEVIAAFELQLSKENVFPPFGSRDNFSLTTLLKIVMSSEFRTCRFARC